MTATSLFDNNRTSDVLENTVGVLAATYWTWDVNIATSAEFVSPLPPPVRTTAVLRLRWGCLTAAAGPSHIARIFCLSWPFTDRSWYTILFRILHVFLAFLKSYELKIQVCSPIENCKISFIILTLPWFRLFVASLCPRVQSGAGICGICLWKKWHWVTFFFEYFGFPR